MSKEHGKNQGVGATNKPARLLVLDNLEPGTDVDGWQVVEFLGQGGFGAVYLVEKEGVRAALKFALPRGESRELGQYRAEDRAEREMICELRIKHPNVGKVIAHGRWPHPELGHFYFVMPLVEGDRLDRWARRHHPTARETVRLFMKLAEALSAAHQLGIVHRDIKAENIIVRRSDSEPIILDFGSADFPQSAPLTDAVLPPGTPTHRSPEAVLFLNKNRNNPEARYEFQPSDDLYALGVTFYDVLTGDPPFLFPGGPMADRTLEINIAFRHPKPAHQYSAFVPESLSNVVSRLLSKDPEHRHASAEALRRDLAALLESPDPALDRTFASSLPRLQGENKAEPEPEAPAAPSPAAPEPQQPPAAQLQPEAAPKPEPRPMTAALAGGGRGVSTMPLAAHFDAAMGAAGKVLVLMLVMGTALGLYWYLNAAEVTMRAGPSPAFTRRAPVAPTPPPVNQPEPERPAIVPDSPEKDDSTVTNPAAPSSPPPPSPSEATTAPARPASKARRVKQACRGLVVGSAAWLAAGCAGAQVRPEPGACPEDARAAMEKLNLGAKDKAIFTYDVRAQVEDSYCAYRPGPVEGWVIFDADTKLPQGTRLFGRAWVDEKKREVWLLYTSAQLPGGERIPVCIRAEKWPVTWSAGDPFTDCNGDAVPVEAWKPEKEEDGW